MLRRTLKILQHLLQELKTMSDHWHVMYYKGLKFCEEICTKPRFPTIRENFRKLTSYEIF